MHAFRWHHRNVGQIFFRTQRFFTKNQRLQQPPSPKKLLKYGTVALILGTSGVIFSKYANEKQKEYFGGLGGAVRFLRSLKTGVIISVDYYVSMIGLDKDAPNYNAMMSLIHQRTADRMLAACLKNGGLYIKLGQGLVSMSHILPKEYIDTLTILQDKCLPRETGEVRQLFLEDFGKEPLEVFKDFDFEPIAAASLAQVFVAHTEKGEKVAVKVQYIDLQRRFTSDINTINFLVNLAGVMHPSFKFGWILDELTSTLKQELDFINEGKNAERCARDLRKIKFAYVPKIYWDKCSTRVLTAEFIDGIKVNDVDGLLKNGHNLKELNFKIFSIFGEQIFRSGFVHADPHPGNVFIRMDKQCKTQVVLLDHGLYQEVSRNDRCALSFMWKAIVMRDHENMKRYAGQLGVKDYEMLAETLIQAPLKSTQFKLKTRLTDEDLQHMTEFARQHFDKIMKTLRDMPSSLLLVIRNLNTIRAIARSHGDPIDRYAVLARIATKCIRTKDVTVTQKIRKCLDVVAFEFRLMLDRFCRWLFKAYLILLRALRRSPDISQLTNKM